MPEKSNLEDNTQGKNFDFATFVAEGSQLGSNSCLICHTYDLEEEDIEGIYEAMKDCELIPETEELQEVNLYFWHLKEEYMLSLSTRTTSEDFNSSRIKRKPLGMIAIVSEDIVYEENTNIPIYNLLLSKIYHDGRKRSELFIKGKIEDMKDSALLFKMLSILENKGRRICIPQCQVPDQVDPIVS